MDRMSERQKVVKVKNRRSGPTILISMTAKKDLIDTIDVIAADLGGMSRSLVIEHLLERAYPEKKLSA